MFPLIIFRVVEILSAFVGIIAGLLIIVLMKQNEYFIAISIAGLVAVIFYIYLTVCFYSLYASKEFPRELPSQKFCNNYQQFANYTYPIALTNEFSVESYSFDLCSLNPYIKSSDAHDSPVK